MTTQTSFSPDTVWIADSGASHHMVSHMHMLETAAPCVNEGKVTVGNGAGLEIDHVGTTTVLQLPTVFHGLYLTANLLSVHQLCKDNNCLIAFDKFGFSIQDRINKQILLTGKSDRGLYCLPSSLALQHKNTEAKACLGQLVKSSSWHARLGHPSNTVVKHMLNKSHISVCDDSQSFICPHSLSRKMHKLPFSHFHGKSTLLFIEFIVMFGGHHHVNRWMATGIMCHS
ncbi:hypothetical protein L3X38_004876 [Prunus dulcis]|uniref:GAG-pre-integrase domain-containing protein n=1 Tax=Prunus dulcis TaxID=3755 RepID=A0AAD4ZPR1_PRUDU|nr:hypothetical protein L3X38_004876 [Prunus dulcis]